MDKNEFKKLLVEEAVNNNVMIPDVSVDNFYLYMNNLLEWNKKINLTAIKEEKDVIVKHFIDSIFINKYIVGCKLLDIGSGAGFPGIPLKLVNDDLEITLIDSVNKKVNFMNNVIQTLDLKNIVAVHVRAEDMAHDSQFRENYDVVVSRAVANMTTLVEYMLPFVKLGGKCLCLKGPNSNSEINLSKKAIKKLGGEIDNIVSYKIGDNERNLVVINKIKFTEQTYPRKQGKPLKEPLI